MTRLQGGTLTFIMQQKDTQTYRVAYIQGPVEYSRREAFHWDAVRAADFKYAWHGLDSSQIEGVETWA